MAIIKNGTVRGQRSLARPREETSGGVPLSPASHHRATYDNLVNGVALRRHAESAHRGEVREDCPACVDIQARAQAVREGRLR